MIDTSIQEPSPLCAFMEQLGKSMCSIEIVNDNASSHSPAPRRRKTTTRSSDHAATQDTNNRWNAVYYSNDHHATRLAYSGRHSNGCYRDEKMISSERAQRRWSTCANSSSLTLTPCSKRRSGDPRRRRNSAEDERPSTTTNDAVTTTTTTTTVMITSLNDRRARMPLHRSWSSPTVCARAPTFVRRLSPSRREREHNINNYNKLQTVQ